MKNRMQMEEVQALRASLNAEQGLEFGRPRPVLAQHQVDLKCCTVTSRDLIGSLY